MYSRNQFKTDPNVFHEGLIAQVRTSSFDKIDLIQFAYPEVGKVPSQAEMFYALRAWQVEQGVARVVQIDLSWSELASLYDNIGALLDARLKEIGSRLKSEVKKEAQQKQEDMAFKYEAGEWKAGGGSTTHAEVMDKPSPEKTDEPTTGETGPAPEVPEDRKEGSNQEPGDET